MSIREFLKSMDLPQKMTIVITLCTCVVLATLGIVIYGEIRQMAVNTFVAEYDSYLEQSVNTIDIILKQVVESCRQYSSSENFSKYKMFANGNYYENINYERYDVDSDELYNYIMAKNKIKEDLAFIKLGNDIVESVYLYEMDSKILFTYNGIQYNVSEFYDTNWITYLRNSQKPYLGSVSRIMNISESVKKEAVTVLYELPDNFVIVVNLSSEKLQSTLNMGDKSKMPSILIVEPNVGHRILSFGNSEVCEELYHNINNFQENSLIKHKSEKYYIFENRTDNLNWQVLIAVNDNHLRGLYVRNKYIMLAILFIFSILPAITVKFLSKKLYVPLLRIAGKFDCDRPDDSNKISFIERSIDNTLDQNTELKKRLEESMPAYIEKFLSALLRKEDYSLEEIHERLAFCGINFPNEKFVVVVLGIDRTTAADMGVSELNLIMIDMTDIIGKNLTQSFKGTYVQDDDYSISVILNCGNSNFGDLFDFVQKIKDEVNCKHNLELSVGIGGYRDSLMDLHNSYQEAFEAYKISSEQKGADIISVDDISIVGTKDYFPKEQANMVYRSIKYADREGVSNALEAFKAEVLRGNLSASTVKRWYYNLCSEVISLGSNAEIPEQALSEFERMQFEEFSKLNDLDSIYMFAESLVLGVTENIMEIAVKKGNTHIDRVTSLVGEVYGNITLSEVSNKLNLNPSYISRLFKKHMKESFSEYLTATRMEYAKQQLEKTELKIYEIGEQIGYNSSFYFIKTFKTYTGFTPANYRKKFRDKNI